MSQPITVLFWYLAILGLIATAIVIGIILLASFLVAKGQWNEWRRIRRLIKQGEEEREARRVRSKHQTCGRKH